MVVTTRAPAYQILREQLRADIAAGHYPDGTRLPTESELVARHGLSRQTVRRAFQDLVAEELCSECRGAAATPVDKGDGICVSWGRSRT